MKSSRSRSRSKNNNRNRGGNNNTNNSGTNVVNRVFDSSGPEGKVRGTPQQIIDKYNQLARDAQLSGDRVALETFQQHAEHYTRMLSEAQREMDTRREEQERLNRERQVERDRERQERVDRNETVPNEPSGERSHDRSNDRSNERSNDPADAPQPDVVHQPQQPAAEGESGLVETPESQPKPKPRPRRKPKPKPAPIAAEVPVAPSAPDAPEAPEAAE